MAKASGKRSTWILLCDAHVWLTERCKSPRLAERVLDKAFKDRRMPWRGRREDGSYIEGGPSDGRIVAYIDSEANSGILGRPSYVVFGRRGNVYPPPVPPERIFAIEVLRSAVEERLPAAAEQSASVPSPRGAPPTYDIPAIEKAAKDVLKHGVPDKQSWLEEKVRDLLEKRHVRAPAPTRMAGIIRPLYKAAKAGPRPSR
jgi:hypothetical protein